MPSDPGDDGDVRVRLAGARRFGYVIDSFVAEAARGSGGRPFEITLSKEL